MNEEKIEVTEATEPEIGKPTEDEQADLIRAIWAAADEIEDCVAMVMVAVCRRPDGTLLATSETLTSAPVSGESNAIGPATLFLRRIIGEAMDRWKARASANVN